MAGGGNYNLNKGYPVLKTYNSSAATGVQKFRAVKFATTGGVAYIDLNAAPTVWSLGIVQEDIDAVKVAYGNAVASVMLDGISKMVVATGTGIVLGSPIMVGTGGGAVLAAGSSTNFFIGMCVGMTAPGGTVAPGDLIDVMLTPSAVKFA